MPDERWSHVRFPGTEFSSGEGKLGRLRSVSQPMLLFGRYRCLKEFAEGAFSQLFVAEDSYSASKTTVAIKVLNAEYASVGVQEAFHLRRVRVLDGLDHCRILPLLNLFYFGKHICMVFPLLGGTLLTRLKLRTFSVDQVRPIALQMVVALRALQKLDVIHADIKPENILIESDAPGTFSTPVFGCPRSSSLTFPRCFLTAAGRFWKRHAPARYESLLL